jgi:hypothetical protein
MPVRVSTTMFCNIRSNLYVEPVGGFVNEPKAQEYFNLRELRGARDMRTLYSKVVQPVA